MKQTISLLDEIKHIIQYTLKHKVNLSQYFNTGNLHILQLTHNHDNIYSYRPVLDIQQEVSTVKYYIHRNGIQCICIIRG